MKHTNHSVADCFTVRMHYGIAKFDKPQIKRQYNVFLCFATHTLVPMGFG